MCSQQEGVLAGYESCTGGLGRSSRTRVGLWFSLGEDSPCPTRYWMNSWNFVQDMPHFKRFWAGTAKLRNTWTPLPSPVLVTDWLMLTQCVMLLAMLASQVTLSS